jgi:quercetin dioxygenase-like cupin family protein
MAKTEYCEVPHIQYVISGRLMIAEEDGTEMELVPGDFAVIAPGHDAWVLGNEPFVAIDCSPAMKEYAQKEPACLSD